MLRSSSITNWLGVLALLVVSATAGAEDWLPLDAAELKMTSEPLAPTAPAIFLYRQVDRDDDSYVENVYNRIKILTEEGREYANVEIRYTKHAESIRYIEARTIRPDGTIVNFEGTIFEKPIVEGRDGGILAKTFTLSDVQVGGIIEYRFRRSTPRGWVYDSHWILSQPLFTKHAKFSLVPSPYFTVGYSWPAGLPAGTAPPKSEHRKVQMETHNVPAFVEEDYMPPENQLKYRVDFMYMSESNKEKDAVAFWKTFAKGRYRNFAKFVDEPRAMEKALAQIIDKNDSPEAKLRKIYARTQQIRNLSYERDKSDEEEKREGKKDVDDVDDVWKQGYGNATEIAWLFVALARAAGFEAHPVLIATRDRYFFNEKIMDPSQLNTNIVLVKLEGKDLFLDPGTVFVPFGVIPWSVTATKGLRLDKSGGDWVRTPLPTAAESKISHKANLRLTTAGSLEGTVTVTYTGQEALWRRLAERNEDETSRKQFLENEVNYDVPSGIRVQLTNTPDWSSSEVPLVAEFEMTVPGWAASAGQRALLTVGLFSGRQKNTFKHAARVHPMYFHSAYTSEDEINIALPTDWRVNSLPEANNTDLKVAAYRSAVEDKGQALQIKRAFVIDMMLVEQKFYPQVRDFFQTVRTHDEEQVVIGPSKAVVRK